MILRASFCLAILTIFSLSASEEALAQEYNALAQCRAQSENLTQVHACMDDYLNTMDSSIDVITDFLGDSLSGESLLGLERSQSAFTEYRKQNCLWYLEFSSPRREAEQIAKNCLASMSRKRLQELQDLVSDDTGSGQTVEGYYVYGAERNSFQPCGGEAHYWVEGAAGAVGQLQQTYLDVATSDLQLLYATLVGSVNESLQVPEAHQGVFQLSSLIEVRVPTDTDCALSSLPTRSDSDVRATVVGAPEQTVEVPDSESQEQDEPEQQLTAYFGAWLVNCIESSARKSCSLEVGLLQDGKAHVNLADEQTPRLILNRTPRQSTDVELDFPGREIDSPTLIRWQVDSERFGDIVGSEIRVDQTSARQLVGESSFLIDRLLPLMLGGREVKISVLESIDDASGDDFSATLSGLTKALSFADDFVRDDG